MRFSLLATQKNFFHQNGYIQFEGLLSPKELAALANIGPGRDLFRSSDVLRKIVLSQNFGELARNLVDSKQLRMGFDEVLASPFWFQDKTLSVSACIRGIKVAFLIALEGDLAGTGIVFSPGKIWKGFEKELCCPGKFLLIAYAERTATYVLEKNDPHTYDLKHLGLVFGEFLSDKIHPRLR